jgi:hypothetical protein
LFGLCLTQLPLIILTPSFSSVTLLLNPPAMCFMCLMCFHRRKVAMIETGGAIPHNGGNSSTISFDFLRLPRELRLILYEFAAMPTRHPIPIPTKHKLFCDPVPVYYNTIEINLLQTCKLVRYEAQSTFNRSLPQTRTSVGRHT